MITAFVAMILAPNGPTSYFDASIRARMQLNSFTVRIETDSTIPGKHEQVKFDLAVKGSSTFLRTREPAHDGQDRSDRSILLTKSSMLAYDAVANESIKRTKKVGGSVVNQLTDVLGPLPEPLLLALDPGSMNAFFSKFRGYRDWTVLKSGSTVTLYRKSAGTETLFRFEGARHSLSEVSMKIPKSRLHWLFQFRSGADVSLNIPADANPVFAFTVRSAPPKFGSQAAKVAVERMTRAYSRLKAGEITVTTHDGQMERLILGGRNLREDRSYAQWAYVDGILTVWNRRTNKLYRGKVQRVILSEYVVAVGGEVDPIIRRLIAHRVPFADLFPTAATVKSKGVVSVNGVSAEILQISGISPQSSIFIREDNHLLDSIESETVETNGRVLTRSQRHFRYKNLGEVPESSRFRINAGNLKALPLPKLKLAR